MIALDKDFKKRKNQTLEFTALQNAPNLTSL